MDEIMESKKGNIWYLLAEPDLFEMVEKAGYGEHEFLVFQKRRFRNAAISTLGAAVPAVLISPWLSFLGIIFFVYSWRFTYTKEKKVFQDELYEKQISWYVFQRLVVSYLTGNGKSDSIFIVLGKILDRLEDGEFKSHVQRLVIGITEDPENVDPFLEFAKAGAGGTDSALTFMTALYNFKNNTHDNSVIDELSDIARKEMMRGIHSIREKKERDFYFFPTKLTMLNVVPLFGFMASVFVNLFIESISKF